MGAAPAYRDGNVLRWLGAYTSSVTGDVVYYLALSWTATRVAGPAWVGLVLAAGAAPRAVLMLAGGVVADRFGPRRVLVGSDLVRCAAVLGVAAFAAAGSTGVWTLAALAAVFGLVDALFMPAVGALPPLLTGPDQLPRVQAMRGLSVRASNAVGPVVGAAALTAGGSVAGFGAAGLLFAASLPLILAVRIHPATAGQVPVGGSGPAEPTTGRADPAAGRAEAGPGPEPAAGHGPERASGRADAAAGPGPEPAAGHGPEPAAGHGPERASGRAEWASGHGPEPAAGHGPERPAGHGPERASGWAELVGGLRYLRADRRLSRLVLVIALSEMCFSGPVAAGLVLLTSERHWSAGTLGWLLAAFSVGGAVTGVLVAAAGRVPRAGVTMAAALAATAVLVTLVGVVDAAMAAVALSAALGAVSGVTGVVGHALLQVRTDPAYLGRVTSVLTLGTVGFGPVLYPLTGLVVAAWGAAAFFACCGVVCALAAATAATRPVRTARFT